MAKIGRITGSAPRPGTPGGSGGPRRKGGKDNYKKQLNEVMVNLNREIEKIANGTLTGLVRSSALIWKKTETGYPITPMDLGNLMASRFTVTSTGKLIRGGGRAHKAVEGSKAFVGKNSARLMKDHSEVITEAQEDAKATSDLLGGPSLVMGYSAFYAGYVHEFVGVKEKTGKEKGGWSREGSGPKWFQKAIFESKDKILEIIRENAKIKK
jgi:hypothetical protein